MLHNKSYMVSTRCSTFIIKVPVVKNREENFIPNVIIGALTLLNKIAPAFT